jgi:hypothetical protein
MLAAMRHMNPPHWYRVQKARNKEQKALSPAFPLNVSCEIQTDPLLLGLILSL